MDSGNVQFVRRSSNAKIGKIPCTTSARSSCPDACPMKGDTSCYAEGGYYTRLNWNKVDSGERGDSYSALLASVEKLPAGTLWRHNVAGDLQGADNRIDSTALKALARANAGRKGFTYTHYPVIEGADRDTMRDNVDAIGTANATGFTVNISANSPAMAAVVRGKWRLPTVTLVPNAAWWKGASSRVVSGERVVRCPAETSDSVTCDSCRLCAVADRKVVVGFTAHGAGKAKTEIIARG